MRWIQRSLGRKLLVSYVLVIVVGVVTLILAMEAVAPTLLTHHLEQMMGQPGMSGMMSSDSGRVMPLDAHLQAAFRDAMIEALAVAATAATLVAVLVSLLVSRQIVGPVRRMVAATRRIAAGHYAERVPIEPATAGDELGHLGASFNDMAGSLEETERRRLALVGDVAHELRTPIATLEGYLEGLLDGVVAPSERTWARLHDEAGRLRRLVDDLQELSRAEARQTPLVLRPVAPAALVQAATERLEPHVAEKGLALRCTLPPALPSVLADQDRAVQVLSNLLTNALRYTPVPGHVTVSAERRADVVLFSVSDSGIGLAPEHLAHLFERFYRVDTSRSRALGGSGIGLTIAKALVEAMGGQITADSPGPGQGSTFSFTLPVAGRVVSAA